MKTSQGRPWKKEKGLSISLVLYMVFPFLLFGQKAWNIHLALGIEDYTASSNHELPQLAVVGLNDNVCESLRHKKNINQLPLESSDGKESTCNAGDPASIPGLGRSGEGNDNPFQYVFFFFVLGLPIYFKFKILFYTFTKTLGQRFDIFSSPHPDLLCP